MEMATGGWNIVLVKWGTERAAEGAGSRRNEGYTRLSGRKPEARVLGLLFTYFFLIKRYEVLEERLF